MQSGEGLSDICSQMEKENIAVTFFRDYLSAQWTVWCNQKCTIGFKGISYVAVPGRNRTLFRCVLRLHYRVPRAVMQYFHCKWGSYVLCKLMNTWHIYPVHMGPTPNRSSALQRFECVNALEIRNGIMFNFYPGLPHIYTIRSCLLVIGAYALLRTSMYYWIYWQGHLLSAENSCSHKHSDAEPASSWEAAWQNQTAPNGK